MSEKRSCRFQGAQFETQFVEGPDGFRMSAAPSRDLAKVAAIAAALVEHERDQEAVILGASGGEQREQVSPWKQIGRTSALRTR
ncbi:MAG: hypothetical protein HGB05_21870 [Chloroflexi bacterium]|nr:hypothetical protein [Chloroflexota bacterium]